MHAAVTDSLFLLKSTPYQPAHSTHKEKASQKQERKKRKVVLVQVMNVYRGSKFVALLILNHGDIW